MKNLTIRSFTAFVLFAALYGALTVFLRESHDAIKVIFYLVAILWLIMELVLQKKLAEIVYGFAFLMLYIITIMGFGEAYGWKGFLGCLVLFPFAFFLLFYLMNILLPLILRSKDELNNIE